MSNTASRASVEQGRLMYEHTDRRGRISLLPLSRETQKLFVAGLSSAQDSADPDAIQNSMDVPAAAQSLTVREWQVFDLLIAGLSNKLIAHRLAISHRTVEIHRAHLMRKMGVRNTASLIRAAFSAA